MIRLRPSGVDEILIKRVQDWYEPGPGVFITSTSTLFSPAMLFTGNTTGAWYDPSDYTTLYRDAAGTTPVTAVEQPVGLMLDKSKNGVGTNGAKRVNLLTYTEQFDNAAWIKSASTAPSVSVTNPVGGALANKLTEDTSNATHTAGQYISATAGTYKIIVYAKQAGRQRFAFVFQDSSKNNGCYAVINLNTANVDVPATLFGTGFSSGSASAVSVGNGWVLCTLTVNAPATTLGLACSLDNATSGPLSQTYLGDGTSGIYIWGADLRLASEAATLPTYQKITDTWYNTLPGNHAFNGSGNSANFPVLSARYNQYLSTETLATQNVITVATNYTLSFTGTGSITLSGTATGTYSAGTYTITCTAGTLTSTVSGTVTKADLRVANDALNQPAYQRVNTSTDYDTVGFKPYLRFNGTNQWLQTNSIDFTYGDKMFVSAGVRKLSDAPAFAPVMEFSSNSNTAIGAFSLWAPNGPADTYAFLSRLTTTQVATASGYSSPRTSVLSGIGNISGDQSILRVNGSQAASNTADQGTGNYGNYPLYIGARAGTSLWANIRFYGAVVAGKQVSAAEITNTETFINQKTGAY